MIRLSLYRKIFIITVITLILVILSLFILQNAILRNSYLGLEEDLSLKSLNRAQKALDREFEYLDDLLLDWCIWDDSYNFVLNRSQQYIDSNLYLDSFTNLDLNMMFFFDRNGNLVRGDMYDLEKEKSIYSDDFIKKYIAVENLLGREGPRFVDTELGLMIADSHPILRSDGSGPPAGAMVVARILDDRYLDKLRESIQGDFIIHRSDGKDILKKLKESGGEILIKKDPDTIHLYTALGSMFLLESISERTVYHFGSRTLKLYTILTSAALAAAYLLMLFFLRIVVTVPIRKITDFLANWQEDSHSFDRLKTERNDEIGILSRGIESFARRLNAQATTDSLTGLRNRHLMDTMIPGLWKVLARQRSVMTVILLDIDHFKRYNDTYGHLKGDACLKEISQILTECVNRESDMIIRYGGEEFLILLPFTASTGGVKIAERAASTIASRKIEHSSSEVSPYVTLSQGIASLVPDRTNTLDQLLEMADMALYRSKEEGRNRISLYG